MKKAAEIVHSVDGMNTETVQLLKVDASNLVSFSPSNFLQSGVASLACTATCHLGIYSGVLATEAHLDKLSLIPPGGCIEPFCVMETEPGTTKFHFGSGMSFSNCIVNI